MIANDIYALCPASLLDLPLIYGLIVEGSARGIFNSDHGTKGGRVSLFKMLFKDIFRHPKLIGGKYSDRKYYVFKQGEQEIGFVSIEIRNIADAQVECFICECSIIETHRQQKHGRELLRKTLELTPAATQVSAFCTTNATAMAALLKTHGFVLVESVTLPGLLPISRYVLVNTGQVGAHQVRSALDFA